MQVTHGCALLCIFQVECALSLMSWTRITHVRNRIEPKKVDLSVLSYDVLHHLASKLNQLLSVSAYARCTTTSGPVAYTNDQNVEKVSSNMITLRLQRTGTTADVKCHKRYSFYLTAYRRKAIHASYMLQSKRPFRNCCAVLFLQQQQQKQQQQQQQQHPQRSTLSSEHWQRRAR
jgi:hypothetical protein